MHFRILIPKIRLSDSEPLTVHGANPKIPELDDRVSWPDMALSKEHLEAVQAIAASPQDLSGMTIAGLRDKGLRTAQIQALLRGVARVASRRDLTESELPVPEPGHIVYPETARGVRWVDLHLSPGAFREASRLAESPAVFTRLSVQEIRELGLASRYLHEIYRAVVAYSRPQKTVTSLPGRTVYVEELQMWAKLRGRPTEGLLDKLLPLAPQVRSATRRLGRPTKDFLKKVEINTVIGGAPSLAQMTLSELLDEGANPGILLDLVSSIEAAGQTKWGSPELTQKVALRAAESIVASPDSCWISAEDLRFGELLRHIVRESANASSAARVVLRLKSSGASVFPRRALLIAVLERWISAARHMRLESELANIGRIVFPPSSLRRVLDYFGWQGGPPRSMNEIAQYSGVSRQRISLVCSPLRTLMDRPLFAPALDRALVVLDGLVGRTVEEACAALRGSGVTALDMHPAGVLNAARLFNRETSMRVCRVGGREYLALEECATASEQLPADRAPHLLLKENDISTR